MTNDKSPHTVAIVLRPDFGEAVSELARQHHVWLVESQVNETAAHRFWELDNSNGDPLESGITTFQKPSGAGYECLAAIVESVDEHHGQYSHDPPVGRLLVYGVKLEADVQESLSAQGFSNFQAEDDHFVAIK